MDALAHVRAVCAALPGTSETAKAGGRPCFQVGGKTFAYWMDDHEADGRVALWLKSTFEVQAEMVAAEPQRFFRPKYAGSQGWLGLRVDVDPDPDEIAAVLEEAWRLQAPKRLLVAL